MRHAFVWSLLMAVSLGFAAPAAAGGDIPSDKFIKKMMVESPPADDGRIVPGWRVGKVHLGMSSRDLLAALGDPREQQVFSTDAASYSWRDARGAGLQVAVYSGRVGQISSGTHPLSIGADSAPPEIAYALDGGLTSGASALRITAMLGEPDAALVKLNLRALCYSTGLVLWLTPDRSQASQFVVQRAKTLRPCED